MRPAAASLRCGASQGDRDACNLPPPPLPEPPTAVPERHAAGSSRWLDAIFLANSGADARPFDWGIDQTEFQIAARIQTFQGRIVGVTRQSDGRYAFVQVRNTGSDHATRRHTHGFASLAALEDFARQMAARPVDVVSYATLYGRRWDAAFIDNANAEPARLRAEFAERFVDAQGKAAIVDAFIALVGQWVKGGKYTTCFGDPNDPAACGPTVHVGASAGLMRLPIRSGPYTTFRVHAYGSAISDIPYSSEQTLDMDIEAYRGIRVELFRGVVR